MFSNNVRKLSGFQLFAVLYKTKYVFEENILNVKYLNNWKLNV